MELKLPPVVVFFLFGVAIYLVGEFLPFGFFDFFGRIILAKLFAGLAFIVLLTAIIQFYISKTTVDPRFPSKANKLVCSGIYKVTRNPMYLAMLLVLLAYGLKIGNAFSTILVASFVAYMNKFQIIPEEKALASKFGKEYREYSLLTRRWF